MDYLRLLALAMTAEWIGLGMSFALILGGAIKMFGYDKRRTEEQEEKLKAVAKAQAAHFEECDRRHEQHAAMEIKVDRINKELETQKGTITWMGDCIVGIATSVGAKIPQRPL